MGRKLQLISILLFVPGFCLMSAGILLSLSGFYLVSEKYVKMASEVFVLGALASVSGFTLLLLISLMIYFNGDWASR